MTEFSHADRKCHTQLIFPVSVLVFWSGNFLASFLRVAVLFEMFLRYSDLRNWVAEYNLQHQHRTSISMLPADYYCNAYQPSALPSS